MLTAKQHELLVYLDTYIRESGIAPSFDEMKDALNLASKSGIHRLIIALEERGFIKRLANRSRAIEILKLPGAMDNRRIVAPEAADTTAKQPTRSAFASVPVMGRIAAGTPIQAIQTLSHTINVPPEMLGAGEHYALEVRGDSMLEAGIFDGDTVLIHRQDRASIGDIVVALIDGEEATLKRLRSKGNSVLLEAANRAYQNHSYEPERVSIQGRIVGLLRKY